LAAVKSGGAHEKKAGYYWILFPKLVAPAKVYSLPQPSNSRKNGPRLG